MVNKPFSQSLYDSNDAAAKEKVINTLLKHGIIAQENPDPYGVDLISMMHHNSYEVEVKHNWTGITFPFQTIHIAARKLKFALDNVRFIILNQPLTWGVVIKGQVVRDSAIIKKDTSLTEREDFISVPTQKATFIKL